jgi:outer membrane protein
MLRTTCACAILVAALLAGGSAGAQKVRIGVVDMQRAVSETQEGKAAEARLMKEKKKFEAVLNRKMKELMDEEEKLRKAWSILKDDEKRKRAADSRKRYEELQKQYVDAERTLMEKKTKEMLKIAGKINKVVQRLAERDKYDYIFNSAAVLWAPRHVDLTNEVIRALDAAR